VKAVSFWQITALLFTATRIFYWIGKLSFKVAKQWFYF